MATFYSTPQPASQTSDWIPLVEYAHKKAISLSTLRRYIKAGKIPYKVDQGRYLLFDDSKEVLISGNSGNSGDQVAHLKSELQRAREEVAELKTLIAFYEERTHHQRPDV
jgi:hypothetical protein